MNRTANRSTAIPARWWLGILLLGALLGLSACAGGGGGGDGGGTPPSDWDAMQWNQSDWA